MPQSLQRLADAKAYASEAIAGHKRIYERETVVSDRLHYLCAGDQAAPFVAGSCLSAFGYCGSARGMSPLRDSQPLAHCG
jgi:hypothetical protein